MAGHLLVREHRVSARKAEENVFSFSANGQDFSSKDILFEILVVSEIFGPIGPNIFNDFVFHRLVQIGSGRMDLGKFRHLSIVSEKKYRGQIT